MAESFSKAVRVTDLSSLRTGQVVEARGYGAAGYAGIVEVSAPALGVVWIREQVGGQRRLLSRDDYSFWSEHPGPDPADGPDA